MSLVGPFQLTIVFDSVILWSRPLCLTVWVCSWISPKVLCTCITHCRSLLIQPLHFPGWFSHFFTPSPSAALLNLQQTSTSLSYPFWVWKVSPAHHETILCGHLKLKRYLHVLGDWERFLLYTAKVLHPGTFRTVLWNKGLAGLYEWKAKFLSLQDVLCKVSLLGKYLAEPSNVFLLCYIVH